MSTTIMGIDELPSPPPPVVAVIDVLRAFTTTAVAFAGGAEAVVLAGSREEALAARSRHPGSLAIKDGPPDPDFDGVNSPVLVSQRDLVGRTVILVTKNGTRGAHAARGARELVCTSFVVASATARYLRGAGGDVTYVATGEQGRAVEDVSCAEYIDALIHDPGVDPGPYLHRAASAPLAAQLNQAAAELGYAGVHPGDVAQCLAEADRFGFVMLATRVDDELVLRAVPG